MRILVIYTRYYYRRILLVSYLAFFVWLYFNLRQNNFNYFIDCKENPYYNFFSKWDDLIYLVLIFTIFGFISTLLEILLTFINSTYKYIYKKRKQNIHKYINETLFDHFTQARSDEKDKEYIQRFKRKYRSDYPRILLINHLRLVMELTTGEVHEQCINLFNHMKLKWLIRTYLNSPYSRHQLFALMLIGHFNLQSFKPKVKRKMNSYKSPIASEAIYTFLKLEPENDLTFLIDRNKPISKLDFNNIINICEHNYNIDYETLVTSKSPMIATLGIYMVGMHQEQSLKSIITRRIDHPDENVRHQAQNTFILLLQEADVPALFQNYGMFSTKNKLVILEMLEEFCNSKYVINFLHHIIEHDEYLVRLSAMQILIKNKTFEVIRYYNHPNKLINDVYKQLTDINL